MIIVLIKDQRDTKMSITETELFFRKNRENGKEPFSVLTLTLSFYSPERQLQSGAHGWFIIDSVLQMKFCRSDL
jgi:hypothetical protein